MWHDGDVVGNGHCTMRSSTLGVELREALHAPRRGFNSCAVVASSGALLFDRFGEEIDQHDAVIRFNSAPVSGFEPIVGAKTSVRVVNSQAMLALLQRCSWPGRCDANASCCHSLERRLLNTAHTALSECFQRVCGKAPSVQGLLMHERHPYFSTHSKRPTMSGAYGLAVAHLLCSRVDAYGFTSTAVRRIQAPYHYYDRCASAANDNLVRTARRFEKDWLQNLSGVRLVSSPGGNPAFSVEPSASIGHRCFHKESARDFSRLIAANVPSRVVQNVSSRFNKIHGTACCRREHSHTGRGGKAQSLAIGHTGPMCTADPRQCEANCTSMVSCGAFSFSKKWKDCFFCRACKLVTGGGKAGKVAIAASDSRYTTWMRHSHPQLVQLRQTYGSDRLHDVRTKARISKDYKADLTR